ncbi:MAG: hypothetical protein O3A20_01035 [Planctomycetota bacterium]|nr:hypothetical protein [Planctomycetota bacterium]
MPYGESLREYVIPMGASGCISIELRDEDGHLVCDPRAVYLEESDSARAHGWDQYGLLGSMSMVAQNGTVHFTGVPLGKRWRVGAFLFAGNLPVAMELEGPRLEAEIISACLNARDESREIHGALLHPDGGLVAG